MKIHASELHVKEDESLSKAVAQEITGTDDKDLEESFLSELSVDYPHTPKKKKTTITEDPTNV